MFGLGGVGQVGKVRIKRALGATGGAPSLGPSLDLDFMTPGVFPPSVVFTRASTGTYFNSAGVMQTAAVNAPRWDYDPATLALRGLLIEEARTNAIPASTGTGGFTSTGVTTTASAGSAPDATNTMMKTAETATTGIHYINETVSVTSGTSYAWSIFAKAAEVRYVELFLDPNGVWAVFDLQTGIITSGPFALGNGTTLNAAVRNVGNGIYRCSVSATVGTTTAAARAGIVLALSGTPGFAPSYPGTVGNGLLVWGYQFEAASFESSYIPTSTVAVTRAAEFCSLPVGAWFNASASSLAAEYMLRQSPNPSNASRQAAGFGDGTLANRMILIGQNVMSATATTAVSIAGVSTVSTSVGSAVANAVSKIAGAWGGGAMLGALNGGSVVTTALGMPAGITTLFVGTSYTGTNTHLNGHVRRVRYWPRPLSDVELQTETTLDPAPPATLNLDFMTPGILDPRLTFTRASSGTYFDSSGVMRTAGVDTPRWSYDPITHALNGVRIERAGTNLCLQSSNMGAGGWLMVGVGSAPPDFLANAVVAPDNTLSAMAMIMPTVSTPGSACATEQDVVASATAYTFSVYLRGASGGETTYVFVTLNNTTYYKLAVTLTTTWTRYTLTTPPLTAVKWTFGIGTDLRDATQIATSAGGFFCWGAQVEALAFATSYMPSDLTQGTRASDNLNMPTTGWFNPSESTLFAKYIYPRTTPDAASGGRDIASLNDSGATNDRMVLRAQVGGGGTTAQFYTNVAGTIVNTNLTTTPVATVAKMAAAFNGVTGVGSYNGAAPVSGARGMATNINSLEIGNQTTKATKGTWLEGYVQQIQYWGRALSNAELQQVTT